MFFSRREYDRPSGVDWDVGAEKRKRSCFPNHALKLQRQG